MTSLSKCDVIPGEMLISQLHVLPDGRIGLPNGMSYAVLSMVNKAIDPDVLLKVVQLIKQGATVWLKNLPEQSSGWVEYQKAQRKIADCLNELGAHRSAGVYPYDRGRLVLGDIPVTDMLNQIGCVPAFSYKPKSGQPFLDYNHRRDNDTDIFFLANKKDTAQDAECIFRVVNKQPELWDPINGQIVSLPRYDVDGETVRLRLGLAPFGSAFVVFRKKVSTAPPREELENIKALTISGPWDIRFCPERETEPEFQIDSPSLFLWNEHADLRLKSFSGTAYYRTEFDADVVMSIKGSIKKLDLGLVHDLAEVIINGAPAGVVWTAPFTVDISNLLRPGRNLLEIRVVNTWHNWRLANKFAAGAHPWEKLGLSLPTAPGGLKGPLILRAYSRLPLNSQP